MKVVKSMIVDLWDGSYKSIDPEIYNAQEMISILKDPDHPIHKVNDIDGSVLNLLNSLSESKISRGEDDKCFFVSYIDSKTVTYIQYKGRVEYTLD